MHTQTEIPNKSLFKSNEVTSITDVKPYVLRFWESEFDQIRPVLSSSGQKLYEHKDIEVVALIKKLLFDDKLTIEQAKKEVDSQYDHLEADMQGQVVPELKNEFFEPTFTRKSLTDSEIQKLVLAKAKLNSILMKTGEIEERYNWS